jgi:hypothetical protein
MCRPFFGVAYDHVVGDVQGQPQSPSCRDHARSAPDGGAGRIRRTDGRLDGDEFLPPTFHTRGDCSIHNPASLGGALARRLVRPLAHGSCQSLKEGGQPDREEIRPEFPFLPGEFMRIRPEFGSVE